VFHRTKHGNIVLEQGLMEIFGLKTKNNNRRINKIEL